MVRLLSTLLFAFILLTTLVAAISTVDSLAHYNYNHNYRHIIQTQSQVAIITTKPTFLKKSTSSHSDQQPTVPATTASSSIITTTSTTYVAPVSTETPLDSVDWYIEMLNQVNIIRAKAGKAAVKLDIRLNIVAQDQADYQNQIKQVTHSNPTGTLGERCTRAGVKWWGVAENAAGGQRDVTSVVTAWKNSKGHYENVIGDYTITGFGVSNYFWTQVYVRI